MEPKPGIMPTFHMYARRHYLLPQPQDKMWWYYFKALLAISFFSSVGLFSSVYTIEAMKQNVDVDLEDTVLIIFIYTSGIILLSIVWKYENLNEISTILASFGHFGKPQDFDRTARNCRACIIFIYYGTAFGISLCGLMRMLEISACEEFNRMQNLHYPCRVVMPMSFKLYDETSFFKHLYNIYLFIAMLSEGPILSLIGSFTLGLWGHLIVRMRHLVAQADTLVCSDGRILRDSLREFVIEHQNILKIVNQINDFTGFPNFLFCTLSSTVLTLNINSFFHESWRFPAASIVLIFCWTILLLSIALTGQKLLDEGFRIGTELYEKSDWFELDVSTQRDISLIICGAQKPLRLRIGPLGYTDLSFLMMVAKGVYTLLVVSVAQRIEN